jgi:hypothetical protein
VRSNDQSAASRSRAPRSLQLGSPWRLVVLAACLALLYQFLRVAADFIGSGDLRDFMQGFSAGQRILSAGWSGLYDLPAQIAFQQRYIAESGASGHLDALPFVSLPLTALLFLPLAALPSSLALAIWIALNFALASGAIMMTARAVATPGALGLSVAHRAPPPAATLAMGIICALGFLPLAWGLLIGQSVGFTLLLFAVAFLALARGQDRIGGLSLALLAMIKPQLVVGPVVFLLVQRRWGALLTFSISATGLAGVGFALVGLDGIPAYLHLLGQMDSFFGDPRLGLYTDRMVNWRSWVARIPGVDAPVGMMLVMALTAATFIVVGYAWRRRASGGRAFALAYLSFAAAGLLCSFHSTYQDLIILLPAGLAALGLDRFAVQQAIDDAAQAARRWTRRGQPAPKATPRAPTRAWRPSRWPGLALVACVFLVVIPGLAWLVGGPHALARVPIWATMAGPALVLFILATVPWTDETARVPGARLSRRLGTRATERRAQS